MHKGSGGTRGVLTNRPLAAAPMAPCRQARIVLLGQRQHRGLLKFAESRDAAGLSVVTVVGMSDAGRLRRVPPVMVFGFQEPNGPSQYDSPQ